MVVTVCDGCLDHWFESIVVEFAWIPAFNAVSNPGAPWINPFADAEKQLPFIASLTLSLNAPTSAVFVVVFSFLVLSALILIVKLISAILSYKTNGIAINNDKITLEK